MSSFEDLKFSRETGGNKRGRKKIGGKHSTTSKPLTSCRTALEMAVAAAELREAFANQHGPIKILMKDGIPQA